VVNWPDSRPGRFISCTHWKWGYVSRRHSVDDQKKRKSSAPVDIEHPIPQWSILQSRQYVDRAKHVLLLLHVLAFCSLVLNSKAMRGMSNKYASTDCSLCVIHLTFRSEASVCSGRNMQHSTSLRRWRNTRNQWFHNYTEVEMVLHKCLRTQRDPTATAREVFQLMPKWGKCTIVLGNYGKKSNQTSVEQTVIISHLILVTWATYRKFVVLSTYSIVE
jgi:hypothetical protein